MAGPAYLHFSVAPVVVSTQLGLAGGVAGNAISGAALNLRRSGAVAGG